MAECKVRSSARLCSRSHLLAVSSGADLEHDPTPAQIPGRSRSPDLVAFWCQQRFDAGRGRTRAAGCRSLRSVLRL